MLRQSLFSPILAIAFVLLLLGKSSIGKQGIVFAFSSNSFGSSANSKTATGLAMSSSSSSPASASMVVPTWDDLKDKISETPVGKALDKDLEMRAQGRGSPHVHSKMRLFDNNSDNGNEKPVYTLFRDHAGWCP